MTNAVVVFGSRHGSTKRYATWIAEELSCDLFERRRVSAADLARYDIIIVGGAVYAGRVLGADLLAKNFEKLRDKRLILFTCGMADPSDASNVDYLRRGLGRVLKEHMQEEVELFHLRGAIDYRKLGPIHRVMMAGLRWSMLRKDPEELRPEDRGMLATYGTAVDFTDREAIGPLVGYVRGLSA